MVIVGYYGMADKRLKQLLLAQLKQSSTPINLADLLLSIGSDLPERTARRWLSQWVSEGCVERQGKNKGVKYFYKGRSTRPLRFLEGLDTDIQQGLLKQIRDLWTHNSTAIEGNTLTLGDTHFLLEEGLTISGKPIKDHQEVLGHAQAIELVYQLLDKPVQKTDLFALHKAVQTSVVSDIYKPNGTWKLEINGTYTVTEQGQRHFIEYAKPADVDILMGEILVELNRKEYSELLLEEAPLIYAKLHMGIVHIHPFWDGNGRIARLLANLPLLKSGLPPLMISQESRRDYIQALASYQIKVSQLTKKSGVWPDVESLHEFEEFCTKSYEETLLMVKEAHTLQNRR